MCLRGETFSITVTAGGATSNGYPVTVRGPTKFVAATTLNSADTQYGYATTIYYKIIDNLSTQLTLPVPFSESFPVLPPYNDYTGTNWTIGAATGNTTSSSNSFEAWDLIQGQLLSSSPSPIPTPIAPCTPSFCTTLVQDWPQDWFVGSTAPGSGLEVQTDVIKKYTDHAVHTSIVSPP